MSALAASRHDGSIDLGGGRRPVAIATDATTGRAYAANQGSPSVSVIDAQAGTLLTTVTLPPPPDAGAPATPTDIVIDPGSRRVYVVVQTGVYIISIVTNSIVGQVFGVCASEAFAAIDLSRFRLYIASGPCGRLTAIDLRTRVVVWISANTGDPWTPITYGLSGMAVDPVGGRIYTTRYCVRSGDGGYVECMDETDSTGIYRRTVEYGDGQGWQVNPPIVLDAAARRLYVGQGWAGLVALDLDTLAEVVHGRGGVWRIDDMVLDPANSRIWAADSSAQRIVGLDTATLGVVESVMVPTPYAVAMVPGAQRALFAASDVGRVGFLELDTVPPALTASVNAGGALTVEADGIPWTEGSWTVSASCTDEGLGCARIEVSVSGAPWEEFPGTATYTTSGRHGFRFRAFDRSGNVSAIVRVEVGIDVEPPITRIVGADRPFLSMSPGATAEVEVLASDMQLSDGAPGSGIASGCMAVVAVAPNGARSSRGCLALERSGRGYLWSPDLATGRYAIRSVVRDPLGHTGSSPEATLIVV